MIYIIIALTIVGGFLLAFEYSIIKSLSAKIDEISRCLKIAENEIRNIKRQEKPIVNDFKFGD